MATHHLSIRTPNPVENLTSKHNNPMKNTTSKHKRLKTSLALGASALGAATSHASVVYWDTSGLSMTVTSILNADSKEFLDISYDSATQQFALGGSYGFGQQKGVEIVAEGKSGEGNWLRMNPLGRTALPYARYTASILGEKGPVSLGTKIDGNTVFPGDDPLRDPLLFPKWDGSYMVIDSDSDLYVGIRILASETPGDYNSGAWNYGWASISTSADGLSMTLNAIAIESEIDAGILVGDTGISAVPEPGNVLSLAALVGSAAFLRSRRKTAASAA